ncbi:MAG: hypothetical protein MUO29_03585, partial [Desulfobacterales bacterium]|nr:hypothetical protein [Desulfobacterales bacterium]
AGRHPMLRIYSLLVNLSNVMPGGSCRLRHDPAREFLRVSLFDIRHFIEQTGSKQIFPNINSKMPTMDPAE